MEQELKLTNADHRLLSIVWEAEPVASPELCRLAAAQLGWKRTTTYTVLKRLCDRGLLRNKNTVVTSNINRETVQKAESRRVLERSFEGSLPKFVAAFLGGEKITNEEAEEIKKMLDEYRGNT